MTTFAAVTTFHREGYELYGREMLETFDRHWPRDVSLYAYGEDCVFDSRSPRIVRRDLSRECPDLVAFKGRHANSPAANGRAARHMVRFSVKLQPFALKRYDLAAGLGYQWDAVRFSHKCFALFDAARRTDADVLLWLDADIRFFADLPRAFLEDLIPAGTLASFLARSRARREFAFEWIASRRKLRFVNRTRKHSECGFVAYALREPGTREFLHAFEALYTRDELFREWETHDSYLFDVVRRRFERRGHPFHDLAEGIGRATSHPLVNCKLGRFMDHKKGDRKEAGKSFSADLLGERSDPYWADAPAAPGAP